jgi:hypothetical protein
MKQTGIRFFGTLFVCIGARSWNASTPIATATEKGVRQSQKWKIKSADNSQNGRASDSLNHNSGITHTATAADVVPAGGVDDTRFLDSFIACRPDYYWHLESVWARASFRMDRGRRCLSASKMGDKTFI